MHKCQTHTDGWIRTAAEPTAACGGNREARLGPRPAGCERQRSRRWEPQPGFLIISAACVIHPARLGNRTALHRPPAHNRRNAFYSCISRMTPYEKAPPPRRPSEAGALSCLCSYGPHLRSGPVLPPVAGGHLADLLLELLGQLGLFQPPAPVLAHGGGLIDAGGVVQPQPVLHGDDAAFP